MSQREILAAHPSVQDLGIQYGGINLAKTSLHRMLINSKPLHEMTDSDFAAVAHKSRAGRVAEPKDAKVKVIKNVTNGQGVGGGLLPAIPSASSPLGSSPLSRAGTSAGKLGAEGGRAGPSSFSVTNTKTNNKARALQGTNTITQLPPRRNPSLVSSAFSYSADGCSDCGSFSMYSCSCCHVKPPSTVGSAATISTSASTSSSFANRKAGGRKYKVGTTYCVPAEGQGALIGSGTARGLSEVHLARLHSRKNNTTGAGGGGNSVGGGANDYDDDDYYKQYENLTSVSQRIGSSASVTSTQIAHLQQELESERRTRLQTQIELSKIRERQRELLDRLASKENANMTPEDRQAIRRLLKEVNQQMAEMGAVTNAAPTNATRGSAIGASIAASDSVLQ